jgi:hypothetical protein
MPNWCSNVLTMVHDDPTMVRRAKDAFSEGRLLDEFVPVPAGLKGTTSPNREPGAEELCRQYGYTDWYDFCVNKWGTKWDVGDPNSIIKFSDNELVVYFDSAWSPPIAAYESLEIQGFAIKASYYEPGAGFCGAYDENGDNYYDLSGMDSIDVQQQIPQWLDDQFNISETMSEFEQEEKDPVTEWYTDGVEATGLEPHEKPKK